MFRDGSTLLGEVVKCDNDTVTFKYSAGGEEKTTVVQAKDLDPYSFYRVRSEHIGRDAGANLELAKYCMENGMFARSITHYRQAKALDASLVESFDRNERDRLLEEQSSKLLLSAMKAIERNDINEAASDLSTILAFFPETKAAGQAKDLVVRVGEEKVREETEKTRKLKSSGEGAEAGMTRLLLEDGTSLTGTVLETGEDSITLQRVKGPGKVTNKISAAKIDPVSFYRVRVRDIGNDAAAHLKLAGYCAQHGLFTRAYFQYEHAKTVDPTLVAQFEQDVLPGLQNSMGEKMLASAKASIKAGDYDRAEQDLAFVLTRFRDTDKGEEAVELLDILDEKMDKRDADRAAGVVAKVDANDQEAEKKRWKRVEPAQKTMEQGRKLGHDALKQKRSSQEVKKFEASAGKFEQALKQLDGMRKKHGEDPAMMAIIEKLEAEARGEAVDAYLSAGDKCVDRSSYDQALKLSAKALKVDPDNQKVYAFQSKVEQYKVIASTNNLNRAKR